MPVKLEFETKEAAPEGLQEHLVESNGAWVFEAETAAEVGQLRKTNGKLREAEKALSKLKPEYEKLSKFAEYVDADLEDFAAWRAAKDAPPNESGHKRGDPPGTLDADTLAKLTKDREREIQKIKDAHKAELAQRDTRLAEVEAKRLADKKRVLLGEIAAKTGVAGDRLSTWMKEASDRYQLDEHENLQALDKEDRIPLDVPADKFSRDTLALEFPFLYESPLQGGSGSQGSSSNAGSMAGLKRSTMSSEKKAEFIRKHGAAAYDRLPLK